MSEPKGPKLELPPELEEELEERESEDAEAASETVSAAAAQEIEELRTEIEGLKDRLLRSAADFQNQRRRLLKEQQDALTFANENLVKDLLGTVDNLERALSHARQGEDEASVDPQNLLEGVELTLRSLMSVLERAGVEVVDACDAKFDPRHHEAMRQVPTPDRDPGSVVEVYQKGYLLKGRLLRPALVAVATQTTQES